MKASIALGVVGLACLLGACGPNAWSLEGFKSPDHGGIKRAAYEMECPESQLTTTDLGDSSMGVSGCGKKAVYKWAYGAGWVNNSAVVESTSAEIKKR